MEPAKAAIWARVSTSDQTAENQLIELREWAANRHLKVVAEFITEDSAWASGNGNGSKGKEFDAKRAELIDGARLRRYDVVLVWGLDRVSRRGTEDMFAFVRRLTDTGCALWSRHDPWVESVTNDFAREILLGVFATVARFESQRRSERIKAGLARRKREGLPVGGSRKGRKYPKEAASVSAQARWSDPAQREALAARTRDEHGRFQTGDDSR